MMSNEQLIFADRSVDIYRLAKELNNTSFELIANKTNGALVIVNRQEVKRPPDNVIEFPHEGVQFLNAYIAMTGDL